MKTWSTIGTAEGFLLAAPLKAPATLPVIDHREALAAKNAAQAALAVACPAAWRLREAERQAEIGEAVAELLRPFEQYREALKRCQAQLESTLDAAKAAQTNQGGSQ